MGREVGAKVCVCVGEGGGEGGGGGGRRRRGIGEYWKNYLHALHTVNLSRCSF